MSVFGVSRVCIQSKFGEMRTRITPNMDTFHTVVMIQKWHMTYDKLNQVMRVPKNIACSNRVQIKGIETHCNFLKRTTYPCRYLDMIPRFARSSFTDLDGSKQYYWSFLYKLWTFTKTLTNHGSNITATTTYFYANVIHGKGAPLEKCCAFLYGTAGPISGTQENQRVIGNGNNIF